MLQRNLRCKLVEEIFPCYLKNKWFDFMKDDMKDLIESWSIWSWNVDLWELFNFNEKVLLYDEDGDLGQDEGEGDYEK